MVLFFLFILVFLALYLLLSLPLFAAPLPLAVDAFVAPLHGVEHAFDLFPILTEELMLFDAIFGYEVESIVSTDCEVMLYLLPVLAAIDVEDELLPGKDVVLVEGTACLFLVLALFKHADAIIIDLNDQD